MSVPFAFELSGIRVEYGGRAVIDGVDLRIAAGESLAFVGPSGAGKTSLLRILSGALRPDAGRVEVFGEDLASTGASARRRLRIGIGFVHQDLALVPALRVHQNVSAGRLGARGLMAALRAMVWPGRGELGEVHALLERVGIGERMFQRTDSLSGGEQQRVALARALFQQPRALLADEPVSSVDPSRALELIRLLSGVVSERSLTCVVSLHQVGLARSHFSRLVGLRDGRVLFDRPASEVGEDELERLYRLEEEEREP